MAPERKQPRSRIFICYRRTDTSQISAELYVALERTFPGVVFQDLTGILAGQRLAEAIGQQLGQAAAVIAVIGPTWLSSVDEAHRRRIDDPNDWVHHELATALSTAAVTTIPVLVQGAKLPPANHLPEPLSGLAGLAALTLRSEAWEEDLESLVHRLRGLLGDTERTTPPTDGLWSRPRPAELAALAAQVPDDLRNNVDRLLLGIAVTFDNGTVLKPEFANKQAVVQQRRWRRRLGERAERLGLCTTDRSMLMPCLTTAARNETWDYDELMEELEHALPEATPLVVEELLWLSRSELHHRIGWRLQIALAELLVPFDDPIVLRAIGSIVADANASPDSSLVTEMMRIARSICPTATDYAHWFHGFAGVTLDEFEARRTRPHAD